MDTNQFWKDELLRINDGRILTCTLPTLDNTRCGNNARVNGLIGGHVYCIHRAIECNGKRFVVLRNPLGDSEWTGPWSNGSKEWDLKWLAFLPELGHTFKEDGQFIMQCR